MRLLAWSLVRGAEAQRGPAVHHAHRRAVREEDPVRQTSSQAVAIGVCAAARMPFDTCLSLSYRHLTLMCRPGRLVVGADAAPHELFNETKPTSQLGMSSACPVSRLWTLPDRLNACLLAWLSVETGMAEKRPVSGQTWMTVKVRNTHPPRPTSQLIGLRPSACGGGRRVGGARAWTRRRSCWCRRASCRPSRSWPSPSSAPPRASSR